MSEVIINGLSSVGEVTVDNATHTITVTISEENLPSILDEWNAGTMYLLVTAILFESDYDPWFVKNDYTVVVGNEHASGFFYGQYMSNLDPPISMPLNSKFVTIVAPAGNQTVTQKIIVGWENEETQETGTVEYDLEVEVVV